MATCVAHKLFGESVVSQREREEEVNCNPLCPLYFVFKFSRIGPPT